ncbi:MAG: DNA translocase FtsK [Gorillibacterium sp.]|nr:DNA translocase FtsK [Gorillibacterium sp.]
MKSSSSSILQPPYLCYNVNCSSKSERVIAGLGVKVLAPKRKRKKKKTKTVLKYELYGIGMLIFSIIALLSESAGPVGSGLRIIFRGLIGVLDWAIPLMIIYLAFFVMINIGWPKKWTTKKAGVLLFLLGFVLIEEMAMINAQAKNVADISPGFIWLKTWELLAKEWNGYLSTGSIHAEQVGGGLIGGLVYAALLFLFSHKGTVLVTIGIFAIALSMVTGISFVQVGRQIRSFFQAFRKGLANRLASHSKRRINPSVKRKTTAYLGKPVLTDDNDDEDGEVQSVHNGAQAQFFPAEIPKGKRRDRDKNMIVDVTPEPVLDSRVPQEDETPFIRDFLDHIEPFTEIQDSVLPTKPVPVFSNKVTQPASVSTGEHKEQQLDDAELTPQQPITPPPPKPYVMPSLQLLSRPVGVSKGAEMSDFKANARKLEATLESFGVRAKVLEVVRGPAVTRYEVQPDVGVKVSRIVSLTDDIALALAAKDIRMEAPIPGKAAIGIEVPNSEVSIVTLREVMDSALFQDAPGKLTVVLGRDISGQPIVGNLAKMPHVLVAGATGSGKSVCINGIITSILYKAKPDEVKFLMIDPKMVELNVYNGIPHLLAPVVTDPRRASLALKKIVVEMEKRYELFSKSGTRNIEGYNSFATDLNNPNPAPALPLIVVIVDELADLMMVAAGDVEDAICRLAQMARAAGIHLIIATQRPSVDVITGVIKANIPSRIAFGVSSMVDSRTILDMGGAEKLLGRGDMLYLPVGASKPVRVQGAFLSDQEVEAVVSFVSHQEKANYQEDLVPELDEQSGQEQVFEDELYDQAVQIVVEAKQASVSLLQRRMRVGYTRAARLIDSLESNGIVGAYEGSKPREVLVSIEQLHQSRMSS